MMKKGIVRDQSEHRYRKMMTAIGATMIIFLALFYLGSMMIAAIQVLLMSIPITQVSADVIYQLSYGTIYLLMFMVPVAFLKRFVKKSGFVYTPMKTNIRLPRLILPIVLGGIVLIMGQAYINAEMVSIFNYSAFMEEIMGDSSEKIEGYQIVLQFIVIAIVPAFCEEFLFRGAILTNCLPFGRANAIVISSLLFALMHQNAAQTLYTFAAGIFLGIVYERTQSIWPGTFLHMVNNATSLVLSVFSQKLGEQGQSDVAGMVLEGVLYVVGIICIAILVIRMAPKKDRLEEGVFGKSLPATDHYAEYPVKPAQAVRHFFNLPMVLFVSFSLLQVVSLLLLSMIYGVVA